MPLSPLLSLHGAFPEEKVVSRLDSQSFYKVGQAASFPEDSPTGLACKPWGRKKVATLLLLKLPSGSEGSQEVLFVSSVRERRNQAQGMAGEFLGSPQLLSGSMTKALVSDLAVDRPPLQSEVGLLS